MNDYLIPSTKLFEIYHGIQQCLIIILNENNYSCYLCEYVRALGPLMKFFNNQNHFMDMVFDPITNRDL